jgi:hypothetical protein
VRPLGLFPKEIATRISIGVIGYPRSPGLGPSHAIVVVWLAALPRWHGSTDARFAQQPGLIGTVEMSFAGEPGWAPKAKL